MALNFEIVKEHPYVFGGIALGGGLLLYLYWRSSSSSASTSTTAASAGAATTINGLDPATAAYNLQVAQLGDQYSLQQLATQTSANSTDLNTTLTNQTSQLGLNDALTAQLANTFSSLDLGLTQTAAQQQVSNASIQQGVQLAEIQAGLPISYTAAAGGPFSSIYSGGGFTPVNNPTSNPGQTINPYNPVLSITQGSNPLVSTPAGINVVGAIPSTQLTSPIVGPIYGANGSVTFPAGTSPLPGVTY